MKCVAELQELAQDKESLSWSLDHYVDDETTLYNWIIRNRESGYIVTHSMIQVQA